MYKIGNNFLLMGVKKVSTNWYTVQFTGRLGCDLYSGFPLFGFPWFSCPLRVHIVNQFVTLYWNFFLDGYVFYFNVITIANVDGISATNSISVQCSGTNRPRGQNSRVGVNVGIIDSSLRLCALLRRRSYLPCLKCRNRPAGLFWMALTTSLSFLHVDTSLWASRGQMSIQIVTRS